jgi:lipopolysaccharide export system permease protein
LEGILIHDVRKPDTPVTTMAATGQVVDTDGQPHMIIFNGRRQELDRDTGKLSELAFDQYVLDLDALRDTPASRMPDPRELTISELLEPSPELLRARGPISHFRGEIHSRLATPFLSLAYAFIGLASILAGTFNRRGMNGRILMGAIAIVFAQALFMTVNGFVARDNDLAFILYAVALLPTPISFALVNDERCMNYKMSRFFRKVHS